MSSETSLQQAIDLYEQGDTASALEKIQQVLIAQPQNPLVRVEFANMLMREKRFDDARDLLQSLSEEDKQNPTALALLGQLDSIDAVVDAPDIDELLEKTQQSPSDCLARQQLSAHYKLRGDYDAAMEQLIEIVRLDRTFNDDAGRVELLKIFDLLGSQHELVGAYRKKLAKILN